MIANHPLTKDTDRSEFEFIVLLRAVAALMVVYDHNVAEWVDKHSNFSWPPLDIIRAIITTPLGIIQDFGFLGVVIFFLVSGFIITHTAQREIRATFAIKRLLRIYPPLIVAVAVTTALGWSLLHTDIYTSVFPPHMSLRDSLVSATLINYMLITQNPVETVAWTLIIEVLFYLLCFVTLRAIQTRPRLAVLVNLSICSLIIGQWRAYGPNFLLFAISVSYIPYLIFGQIIYCFWSKRIDGRSFAVLAGVCYLVILYSIQTINTNFAPLTNSYTLSFIYAVIVFGVTLLANERLKIPRLVRFISTISFSLYLYHGMIGRLCLVLLIPSLGYTAALVVSVAASILVAYLSWRFVEKPAQQVARTLIRRLKLAPSGSASLIIEHPVVAESVPS